MPQSFLTTPLPQLPQELAGIAGHMCHVFIYIVPAAGLMLGIFRRNLLLQYYKVLCKKMCRLVRAFCLCIGLHSFSQEKAETIVLCLQVLFSKTQW